MTGLYLPWLERVRVMVLWLAAALIGAMMLGPAAVYAAPLELPPTQLVLGDALGLTPVHLNRVLRQLRLQQIMALRGGMPMISSVEKLARAAGFDEQYLQRRFKRAA